MRSPEQRFLEKLSERPSGCIEWTASLDAWGYGQIKVDGQRVLAHRFAWTLARGAIQPGLCVLHRCDNPPCCNVEHLFLGTVADNNADRSAKGRSHAQQVTHCPRRHPYDEANTYYYPDGRRECRECSRQATRRRRAAA